MTFGGNIWRFRRFPLDSTGEISYGVTEFGVQHRASGQESRGDQGHLDSVGESWLHHAAAATQEVPGRGLRLRLETCLYSFRIPLQNQRRSPQARPQSEGSSFFLIPTRAGISLLQNSNSRLLCSRKSLPRPFSKKKQMLPTRPIQSYGMNTKLSGMSWMWISN